MPEFFDQPPSAEEVSFIDNVAAQVAGTILVHDLSTDHARVAERTFQVAIALLRERRRVLGMYQQIAP